MEAIIDESHKHGFTVITHALTLDQARDAVKAGTDGLAHVFIDEEIDDQLLQAMQKKDVFCIPTLAVIEALAGGIMAEKKYMDWPLVKSGVPSEILKSLKSIKKLPGLSEGGLFKKEGFSVAKKNVRKMRDAGIKIIAGTDAGNPAVFFGPSVHREMELMLDSGLSPLEVIQAATKNAAEVLNTDDKLGLIEQGKTADILLINGNPLENIKKTQDIALVIKNGEILDRNKLAAKINPGEKTVIPKSKTVEAKKVSMPIQANTKEIDKIVKAKAVLQEGVNTWNSEKIREAKDLFLSHMMKDTKNNPYLPYYIALCDYRLTTYCFTSGKMDEAEAIIIEGKKYLEKAIEMDPSIGELYSLYATFLGTEIAFSPDKAMTLGMKSFGHLSKALSKSPDNPRVNLLKGTSELFTPAEYGGGPDTAIKTLNKAVELFEKENITDPLLPSWGKDEAFTFLGMAYAQKENYDDAKRFLKKALETNPENSLAREELGKLEKK
jgi:tetratricopeptide (TPR) repeat protein